MHGEKKTNKSLRKEKDDLTQVTMETKSGDKDRCEGAN